MPKTVRNESEWARECKQMISKENNNNNNKRCGLVSRYRRVCPLTAWWMFWRPIYSKMIVTVTVIIIASYKYFEWKTLTVVRAHDEMKTYRSNCLRYDDHVYVHRPTTQALSTWCHLNRSRDNTYTQYKIYKIRILSVFGARSHVHSCVDMAAKLCVFYFHFILFVVADCLPAVHYMDSFVHISLSFVVRTLILLLLNVIICWRYACTKRPIGDPRQQQQQPQLKCMAMPENNKIIWEWKKEWLLPTALCANTECYSFV